MADKRNKVKRGFAAMDPEKAREIHQLSGTTSQGLGKAHRFTSEEAQEAGKRGGRAVSRDRSYMAEIGRRGGKKAGKWQSKAKDQNSKEP